MNRANRLKPVAELESQEADHQAQRLSELHDRVAQETQRLDELQQYRQEYENRLSTGTDMVRGGQLRDAQVFMAQLNEAIAHQQSVVDQAEKEAVEQAQVWREQFARAKALELIMERLHRDERAKAERQVQKGVDDLYASRFGQCN